MMQSNSIFFTVLLLIALSLSPLLAASQGPVELVQSTSDELFMKIDANRSEYERDVSKLQDVVREILVPRTDKIYSARLVLGRAGRELDRSQIEEFAEALSELLIKQYADALLAFEDRGQVEVLPLAGDNTERMTRVRTRIRLASGARVPVDYIFRKVGDEWKIFDVIAEGISYVATFRNQIGEQIRREGFEAVLRKIQGGELEVEFDG